MLRAMLQLLLLPQSIVFECIAVSLTAFLSTIQSVLNLSLGYDRCVAIARPMEHRSGATVNPTKRRLVIASIVSFAVTSIPGPCSVAYKFASAFAIAIGVYRLVALAILLMIYINIFKGFKGISAEVSAACDRANTRKALKKSREKHLQKLCFGIAATYFALTTPSTIYKLFSNREWILAQFKRCY